MQDIGGGNVANDAGAAADGRRNEPARCSKAHMSAVGATSEIGMCYSQFSCLCVTKGNLWESQIQCGDMMPDP